jgi:hypothetical protein
VTAVAIPHIGLPPGPLSGDEAFARVERGLLTGLREGTSKAWEWARERIFAFAGYSDAYENAILDRTFGDPATALTAADPTYLALVTVAVAETDIGATGLDEATYTGYARKAISAADMGAASAGAKSNSAQQQFAACTGSSSVIIGWACVTGGPAAAAAGDVTLFGTCTSTTISTTQTPATIAVGALSGTLD